MVGFLNVAMAVAAVQPELSDVQIMAKRHRLGRFVTNSIVFWGEIIGNAHNDTQNEQAATNRQL